MTRPLPPLPLDIDPRMRLAYCRNRRTTHAKPVGQMATLCQAEDVLRVEGRLFDPLSPTACQDCLRELGRALGEIRTIRGADGD
jgi:hypothetical protein